MLDDDLERMHKALGERIDDITDRKKHYVMKKIIMRSNVAHV